jgi:splicing factor 3A subunit 1
VVKLTAQFVARNGQKFLQGLTEREARNPQFDFLKPTHGLFGYFTQLVEAYSNVIIPHREHLHRLEVYSKDGMEVLKTAAERYLWDKRQDEEHKRKTGSSGNNPQSDSYQTNGGHAQDQD